MRSRKIAQGALVMTLAAVTWSGCGSAATSPAATSPGATSPGAFGGTEWAFVGVNVVPMDTETVLEDHTVVVRDGRIAALGPRTTTAVPADARVVEGRGRYLMPGLVDMHIHVVSGTGEPGDGAWQQMALLVANGVTTARSLAGAPTGPALRDAIEAGALVGPELYLAGPSLNFNSVQTPEAARAAVREQAAAGYDVIKTHGVSSEVYDAIIGAAAEAELPLSGHVVPSYGLERALAAGQQIEHLDGYLAATVPEAAGVEVPASQVYFGPELDAMSEAAMADLARRTVEAGVWNTPTLALFEIVAAPEPVKHYTSLPEMAYVPEKARAAWAAQVSQMAGAPVPTERRARYLELRRAMTRALYEAGGGLMAGSDSPQFFMAPGFALHRELAALRRAGLSAFDVLATATRNPARYLGETDRFGVIAEGREADLILLEANPLRDIANVRRIAGVMLDGRWLDAARMEALTDSVAAAANPGAHTDPAGETEDIAWRSGPDLDIPRDHHGVFAARASGTDFLYVAGGTDYQGLFDDVSYAQLEADGALGEWKHTTPLPSPRAGVAVQVVGDMVILTGGQISTGGGMKGLQRIAEVHTASIGADGTLGSWRAGPAMPAPRFHHPMVAHDGWVYVVGGQGGTVAEDGVFGAPVNDGRLGEWVELRSLPRPRSHHAALVIDGHLYVFGGTDGSPGGYQAAFTDVARAPILEDGALGDWQLVSMLPHAYATHAAFVRDGWVWLLGGVEDLQRFTDAVWRGRVHPNGAIGPWEAVAPGLPLARGHVHVTPVVGGRVYSVGGRVVAPRPTVTGAVHVGTLPIPEVPDEPGGRR